MRYMVFVGTGVILSLVLYGFSIASTDGQNSGGEARIIISNSGQEEVDELRAEIDRLRSLASIREVLEVYYPSGSIDEKRELAVAILEACEMYDLPVKLVLAVIQTESAFDGTAISRKGALGLMQLLPSTGFALARELRLETENRSSLFDSRTNVILGCYYLKKMLDRYGKLDHALLAYNSGPTRFDLMRTSDAAYRSDYAALVRKNMAALSEIHFSWEGGSDN